MPTEHGPARAATSDNHTCRILLFAQLREQMGWSERWLQLNSQSSEPLTPASVWADLQLPGSLSTMRIAINHRFADPHTPLQPGDELAFLPPISGG